MEILDFELKIKTTGIRVKHIIISYNGYDYVYDKICKNLFMKPYDIYSYDIYIVIYLYCNIFITQYFIDIISKK